MRAMKQGVGRIAYEVHVKARLEDLYNFDKFTELQRKIINEVGCTACTSGVNLRFDIEQIFGKFQDAEIVDVAANAKAPSLVRVVAPKEVANRFDLNTSARRAVLGELGCPQCTSGYNIVFEHELAFAVDEKAALIPLDKAQ